MKKVWPYLITVAICLAISITMLITGDAFKQSSLMEWMGNLSDAFIVPGLFSLCLGFLIISTNGGTFDMLAYGVIKLFDVFKKDLKKSKYKDFNDYRQQQTKRDFDYFLIIGGIFTVIGIVFLIIHDSLI